MSTLYLIRHGRTEANEQHLYCGKTDLSLTPAGAENLKKLHYDVHDVQFITSGMKRTNETLRILFGPVPFAMEPRLQEMNFGAFEMKSYEQLKDEESYQHWISGDNEHNVAPGGESGARMERRALAAFEEICRTGKNTVIVTHGGIIAAIMAALFPEENRNRYQWQPMPGHGYVLRDGTFATIP